ncbi:MAG: hypothetical protein Fur0010_04410 [Bdellovibrio sp.]
MKYVLFAAICLMTVACSSKKITDRKLEEREHEEIKRDYSVVDASSPKRSGWLEDAEIYASQNNMEVDKFRYFAFETEPKVSRTIACDLAKAQVRADIAAEIATFIDKQLTVAKEGDSSIDENNPSVKALKEFTESKLTEKVLSMVHGAEVFQTYWEKRKYQQSLGAKKDFTAYTCAVFVRMDSKRLAEAVDEAASLVEREAKGDAKALVKKALNNASDDFIKEQTARD